MSSISIKQLHPKKQPTWKPNQDRFTRPCSCRRYLLISLPRTVHSLPSVIFLRLLVFSEFLPSSGPRPDRQLPLIIVWWVHSSLWCYVVHITPIIIYYTPLLLSWMTRCISVNATNVKRLGYFFQKRFGHSMWSVMEHLLLLVKSY